MIVITTMGGRQVVVAYAITNPVTKTRTATYTLQGFATLYRTVNSVIIRRAFLDAPVLMQIRAKS
jgi:hypothetical protein